MTMIGELFASGRIADLILLILAAEFAFLSWRAPAGRRRTAMVELVFRLAPGACLLLALRAALTGGSWMWIAAWLAASFPVHLGDLIRRPR